MTDDEKKRQKGSISPIAETQRGMALAAVSDNTDTDDTDVFWNPIAYRVRAVRAIKVLNISVLSVSSVLRRKKKT